MSENYIVINGKKADLTPEQLKALGIEVKKPRPFDRAGCHGEYYLISATGEVMRCIDHDTIGDRNVHKAANYCVDKGLLLQQAYRETLNRLLWRFSMEHDGDKFDWNDKFSSKYHLYYNHVNKNWDINSNQTFQSFGTAYFYSFEIAKQAIEEIVKPFMVAHPDFKL